MAAIASPLSEMQLSLLRLTATMSEVELEDLRRLIIALKFQRLSQLADAVWDAKGWTQETMDAFLAEHMRTPYRG